MSKDTKTKDKRLDETFSITMELERPLLYNEDLKNSKEIEGKNRKNKINIFKVVGIIFIISIIGFCIWINDSYSAKDIANSALISDNQVEVTTDEFISFTPKNIKAKKGFIFYPADKVEAEAYASLCKEIAKDGYKVVIVPMPLNLPVLGSKKANKVINQYTDIEQWIIGGHSTGGTVASKFASNNNLIDGVVFLASYPLGEDLKHLGKNVLSIWGSKDGVVNFENLVKSKEKLPSDTEYVEIEGGNHSQFGDYGEQTKDNKAIITPKKQLEITASSISKFLEKMN